MDASAAAPRRRAGPLSGLRVLEFAGLGPAPFACMLLADLGADVITLTRPDAPIPAPTDIVSRGRGSRVPIDLKDPQSRPALLQLVQAADVLIEGFRPGVMERLRLGPDRLCEWNPRLIYGRMTGWGQTGPLALRAGHDINYIALSGVLAAIGEAGRAPVPPLNLVGDYGGGSLYLLLGVLAALFERQQSGRGQVVDAAIVDGCVSLLSVALTQWQQGEYPLSRGANLLDGSKPYYAVYRTADAQFVGVGPIEPQFFAQFCELVGIPEHLRAAQDDPARADALRAAIAEAMAQRTRAEWQALAEAVDACLAPVLNLQEAIEHPHHRERETFRQIEGVWQAGAVPRFSRTPGQAHAVGRELGGLSEAVSRWTAALPGPEPGAGEPASG